MPFPQHIVVTRPIQQGESLVSTLQQKGYSVSHIPSLQIHTFPLDDHTIGQIETIDQAHLVVVSSANAVPPIAPFWPENHRPEITIAMGPGTKKAMLDHHLPVDFIPPHYSSEGVLSLLSEQTLSGKSVLIISGRGGSELLQIALSERGAMVEKLAVYERRCPPPLSQPDLDQLMQAHNLIVCTSHDSLLNWYQMIPDSAKSWLRQQQLLVITPKLQAQANELGFNSPPWIADDATDQGLVAAIDFHMSRSH